MEYMGNANRTNKKRVVLVIEDNEINREMLCGILEEDFSVLQAEDGLEGLAQLEAHSAELSLVLLDVYMPNCNGFEFLSRKAEVESYATIPVIVTTASGLLEDERRCLELGANDFVVKPYDPQIIVNRIQNMIRLRETASIVNQLTWDAVTGLYSKEFFYRAVEDALEEEPAVEFDLICSEIENLKALNDRHGEQNCNILLHELAQRLGDLLPDYVAGGRLDSDMFAFLIRHQPRGWEDVLLGVMEGLTYTSINLKFGIVECVDRTMAVPKMCSRAISAFETTKGRHGVEIGLFDDELHRRYELEQTIRECMEQALGEFQFSVFYQPKHNLHTGRVGGAEALVRWHHPEEGFISPGMFVPIFERNGFITKLDLFVWEEACIEIKRCQELGLPVIPISVNASRIDFDEPDLPSQISQLADRHGVDHELLHIELTETAYTDNPDRVVETLRELKALGFSTELDDFGAGYSSLVSLNMLPLDVMKLDMSMIHQATELGDFRIMESTIALAKVLGLQTVVEGVETAEEAEKMKAMGCDMIQGFYYSRPLRRDDFEEYLRREA